MLCSWMPQALSTTRGMQQVLSTYLLSKLRSEVFLLFAILIVPGIPVRYFHIHIVLLSYSPPSLLSCLPSLPLFSYQVLIGFGLVAWLKCLASTMPRVQTSCCQKHPHDNFNRFHYIIFIHANDVLSSYSLPPCPLLSPPTPAGSLPKAAPLT